MARAMGFDCPECGEGAPLAPPHGPLRARTCGRCGGSLLGPLEVERFRAVAVVEPGPTARPPLPCPSCGEPIARLALGETPYAECAGCGVAWVGRGPMLGWVVERLGPEAPRGLRRPARLPLALGLAMALIAAAALAGYGWTVFAGRSRPVTSAKPAPPSQPLVAPAPSAPPAPSAAPPAAAVPPVPGPGAPSAGAAAPAKSAPARAVPTVPAAPLGSIEELPGGPGEPRVLLAQRESETATMVVRFSCGSVDDELPGLTRVAQHALLSANGRLDLAQFTDDVHAAAAMLHMSTGVRSAVFTLTADRRDFSPLARRLATALLDPRFVPARLQDAVDRARLDTAGEPELLQTLAILAGDDTRYGNPPVADAAELDAITAKDVARHLGGPLAAANAVVVVSGAFDRTETVELLRSFRGGEPATRGRLRLATPFATRRRSPQEYHVLAFPLTLETPRQVASARLLEELLTNALWRRFRQAGVAYAQDATVVRNDWIELLVIAMGARDPSVGLGPVLRELVAEVREGKIPDGDLERARSAVRARLRAIDADPATLAPTLADAGRMWQSPEVAAEVDGLDRAALVEAIRPWLDPSSSLYFYLGSQP